MQHSAPPRRYRGRSARYERHPMEPRHHHRQPPQRWCQAHASSKSPHVRTSPRQPPPTAQPHLPPSPSAAPKPARSAPPPGDPCRFAAPAPAALSVTNQGGHQGAGPSWLPPRSMRPSTVLPVACTSGVSVSLPAACLSIKRGTRAATAPLPLMPPLSPFLRPTPVRRLHLTTPFRLPLASA